MGTAALEYNVAKLASLSGANAGCQPIVSDRLDELDNPQRLEWVHGFPPLSPERPDGFGLSPTEPPSLLQRLQ